MSEPQAEGRWLSWLNAVKGLTVTNVLVIAMLAMVAVPVYVIYRALEDEKLLDRFLSTYEEMSSQHFGCTIRHIQERGGPEQWALSSAFAAQGQDRWVVAVITIRQPDDNDVVSHCETLRLIIDQMLDHDVVPVDVEQRSNSEIHGRPVPGAQTDGRRHDRDLPAAPETEAPETRE